MPPRAMPWRGSTSLARPGAPHFGRAYAAVLDDEQVMLSPPVADMLAMMPLNPVGGFRWNIPASPRPAGRWARPRRPCRQPGAGPRPAGGVCHAIARYREGMARGVTSPRPVVETLIGQIDALLARPPERSLFMTPAQQAQGLNGKSAIAARNRLRAEYRAATLDAVYPAYRTLRAFLANEYLPAARTSVGLDALPGGAALYRALLRHHTTLDCDPAQVHALGLAEVARIQAEMDVVKGQLGYTGPCARSSTRSASIRAITRARPTTWRKAIATWRRSWRRRPRAFS
jgi:hypothetical protein